MTGHTSNPVVYLIVFGGLVLLTLATAALSTAPIGVWHTPAGLAIAVAKAALVVLFFMHALHSEKLTWAVIFAAVGMLAILIVGTLSDYLTRPWLTY